MDRASKWSQLCGMKVLVYKNTSSTKTFKCLLLWNTVNFFPPVILSPHHFYFFGFIQLRALSSLKLMLDMGNNVRCWRTV